MTSIETHRSTNSGKLAARTDPTAPPREWPTMENRFQPSHLQGGRWTMDERQWNGSDQGEDAPAQKRGAKSKFSPNVVALFPGTPAKHARLGFPFVG